MNTIEKPWEGTTDEVLKKLETSEKGLTDFEAQKRVFKFGANSISKNTPVPFLQIFFDQFSDLLVLMLIFGLIISSILFYDIVYFYFDW